MKLEGKLYHSHRGKVILCTEDSAGITFKGILVRSETTPKYKPIGSIEHWLSGSFGEVPKNKAKDMEIETDLILLGF